MKPILQTLIIILLFPSAVLAQKSIELTGHAGYTGVDLDALVEEDEIEGTFVRDWDQFASGGGIQFFFTEANNISIGGEIMYQYLYWYQVRVPFGSQPITREYDVDLIRLTPIARFGSGMFAFDAGPEINFIDGVNLGLMLAGNIFIPITEKISIPIRARVDVFNYIVLTAPISLNVGIKVDL